jgi:hypothetical protein
LLAFAPDRRQCQQPEFLLWLPPSFIFFWPLLETHNHLPCLLLCMTRHSFRHVIPVSMNVFYSDSKTDLKLWCDCL